MGTPSLARQWMIIFLSMEIRLAEPNSDYERIADLRNLTQNSLVSAATMRQEDQNRDPNDFMVRAVGDVDGFIAATGHVGCSLWDSRGLHFLKAWVDPDYRCRGYGSRLLHHLEELALEHKADLVKCTTSENDTETHNFLKHRGYRFNSHAFSSALDLTSFEASRYSVRTLPQGVRFFTFADTPMDEDARQKLWELNTESVRDEPNNDPEFAPAFEDYCSQVIGATWFDPSTQFIAAMDDEWVGVSAVGGDSVENYHNLFTGVKRAHRGKGIAKALKVLALSHSKERGIKRIRTGNDSRNAPMLEINRQLGYSPMAGVFEFRKKLQG
jgi:GNAT superfamily N-acetyltransferase